MKRLLAMLLAVVMTVSCLPTMAFGVFASEEETVEATEAVLVETQEDPQPVEEDIPVEEEAPEAEETQPVQEELPAEESQPQEAPAVPTKDIPVAQTEESDACGEKLTWELADGVLTISGEGAMSDYSEEPAPWYGESVEKIVLEEGVTTIGAFAFCDLTDLTVVSLPSTLLTIDACAFQYCTALESVKLPEKLQGIGDYAFNGCYGLIGTLTIPASVALVGDGAFMGCDGLTGVNVGGGLSVLSEYIFAECDDLKNVKLANGLKEIKSEAFAGCASLKSITIPSSVVKMSAGVFSGCTALESITLPYTGATKELNEGDTCYPFGYIFGSADYADSISVKQRYFTVAENPTYFTTTYYIPESLTKVTLTEGDVRPYAFYNCSGLKSVAVSDETKYISDCSFGGCADLEEIMLPVTVTHIGESAFDGCGSLATVWYEGTQKQWEKISIGDNNAPMEDVEIYCVDTSGTCGDHVNWVLDDEGTLIITGTGDMEDYGDWIYVPWYEHRQTIKNVVIREGVTSIGGYAFYGHSILSNVTIPDTVEKIGDAAFYDCAAVSKLTLPEDLSYIGDEAFYGCAKLSGELALSENLTYLGAGAFANCRKLVGTVTVPASVGTLQDSVFYGCTGIAEVVLEDGIDAIGSDAFNGCSNLLDITIAHSVASIGDRAFSDCASLTGVALPDAVVSIGEGAFYCCFALEEITLPAGVTKIGNETFNGCIALTEVTIPDTVEAIGDYAFSNCISLAEITLPAQAVELGEGVFADCVALTEVEIPEGMTAIGNGMFSNCIDLETVIIPEGVTEIGANAFSGCVNLTDIVLPESLTSIGDSAFYGCENLEGTFVIPENVKELGSGVFADCYNLTCVTLPEGIKTIGDNLFNGCNNLDDVIIPAGVTKIGEHAFNGCVLLTEMELPAGLKSIGKYAFANCANLAVVTMPASVNEIGEYAFSSCTALKEITIPAGVTAIKEGTFDHCILLTNVQVPAGVTSIGNGAFANCLSLLSVTIPYSVQQIGENVFLHSSAINHVLFAGLPSQWGTITIHESNTLFTSEDVIIHYKAKGNEVTTGWIGGSLYGYCSLCEAEMEFGPVDVATCLLYMDQEVVYTGSYIRPQVFLYTVMGKQLVLNTDYTVSYSNNKNVGKAVVTVTGKGDCTGTFTANFTILPPKVKNVKEASVTGTSVKITYDGVLPASHYDIYVDGEYVDSTGYRYYTLTDLTPGQTYEVNVVAAKTIGETTYVGEASDSIMVRPSQSIKNYSASLEYAAVAYDGTAKMPDVTLKTSSNGTLLTEGEDYEVQYQNNRLIGEAKVTITGVGCYSGTITKTFTVNPGQVENLEVVDMTSGTVTISFDPVPGADEYWIYRGGTRRAKITDTTYETTGLKAGTTYKFYVKAVTEVDGDDYVGEASETVSAKPTYTIDDYTLTVTNGPLTYTGKAITPSVKLKSVAGKTLRKGTDYTIACTHNVEIGTATVTATGKGKYSETISTTFQIVPAKVNTPSVKVIDGNVVEVSYDAVKEAQWYEIYLNGESIGITTKTTIQIGGMTPGKTYKVSVTAGATVDGENYVGKPSNTKSVKPIHKIADCDITLSNDQFVYTGKWIRPEVTVELNGVELTAGEDYTLKYRNNMGTGKAYVEIIGKGGYTGSVKKEYTILPVQVTGVKVKSTTPDSVRLTFNKSSSITYYEVYLDGVYRGKTSGSSYTLNDLETGVVHEVVMKGRKTVGGVTYYGAESDPIYVWAGTGIGSYYAKLEYTNAVYEGYELYPSVVLKTSSRSGAKTLTEGVDYYVSYENNDGPGKAKVVIYGIGIYTGTITKTFTIKPAEPANVTATALSKSKIEVSFDAVDGATSYWVYVNGYRKAKITDTTCTISGLSKNRTYKITVKAVATVDGTNYTSDYTEVVKVKTLN